jgi:hypothetical protein
MFHRAFVRGVCIWSMWVREKVVAPAGITAIVVTACCSSPPMSGGTGENDTFVITSAARAGDPIRSIAAARNRTVTVPACAGDLPEKNILMMEYAASHR